MIKSALLFLLLFCSLQSDAQYIPLLHDNKVWHVEYADYVTLPPDIYQQKYKLTTDTLIQGIEYKTINNTYIVREDLLDHTVYQYEEGSECLLYDFMAIQGDTLELCNEVTAIVNWVENITLESGESSRKLYVTPLNGTGLEYFIEGVGSNLGLIELTEPIGPPNIELLCLRKDNQIIYDNRCEDTVSVENITNTDPVILYPNPFSDKIYISTDQEISRICIYNIEGSLLLSTDSSTRFINAEHLAPGYYLIQIHSSGNEVLLTQKIIRL